MEIAEKEVFISMATECPFGHSLRVEMLSGTRSKPQSIQCPSCNVKMTVIAGDIRGLVAVCGDAKAA
jgi:hypothetical protein